MASVAYGNREIPLSPQLLHPPHLIKEWMHLYLPPIPRLIDPPPSESLWGGGLEHQCELIELE